MTAFDDALDALYADANLAADVDWTAAGAAEAVTLRAVVMLGTSPAKMDGFPPVNLQQPHLKVRASEVSEKCGADGILKDDEFSIGGAPYLVNGAPYRQDGLALEWTVPLAPLPA